jgi:hypothetical protein
MKPVTSNDPKFRRVIAFPDINLFYNMLYDRIHSTIERIFLEKPFTLFINALPRTHEPGVSITIERFGSFPLLYAGTETQKKLLIREHKKEHISNILSDAFDKLNSTEIVFSLKEGQTGSKIFTEFVRGELSLEDLQSSAMGKLSHYFKPIFDREKKVKNPASLGPFMEEEYSIIKEFFNIKKYNYISLPLIQFAEFDGLVHVIYHEKEYENFVRSTGALRKKTVSGLIKAISLAYENLIIEWDIKNSKEYKDRALREFAQNPNFYKNLKTNKLLNELGYLKYYQKHGDYFLKKIDLSDDVPEDAKDAYRLNAITTILMDSYTHNISAHSMVALESWLQQRAYKLLGSSYIKTELEQYPFVNDSRSYDNEIYEFIRFMLNKGAFWTGLHRDRNYGGKVISLFEVLNDDFIANPLYLGTIAYSEGITRLNLYVTIVKREEDISGHAVLFKKRVIKNYLFATVDLKKWIDHPTPKDPTKYLSGFITLGPDFDEVKDLLQRKYKVFFPGGVVGVHSFLTILENEIRNVKHFSDASINEMRQNGLNLNISIEERTYNKSVEYTEDAPEYYQIGVWLKHAHTVELKTIKKRLTQLYGDVINDDNMSNLGGTTQDKICSAFLFNNYFSSVQPKLRTARDKWYFPWIKTGFSVDMNFKNDDLITEYEISARRLLEPKEVYEREEREKFKDARAFIENNYKAIPGHYKKFFYLWRGEDLYNFADYNQTDNEWENIARFKFVYLPSNLQLSVQESYIKLRKDGVIRILEQVPENIEQAYVLWLKKWLKPDQQLLGGFRLRLIIKEECSGALHWNEQGVYFVNKTEDKRLNMPVDYSSKDMYLMHGKDETKVHSEDKELRFRSHGILIEYFFNRNIDIQKNNISSIMAGELIEVLSTQICIFDNRIYKEFININQAKMRNMGCEVYNEDISIWSEVRATDFFRFHFLILHLSFIENMVDKKGNKYSEDRINEFIDNEILGGIISPPDNFFLVITSGRGRKQWQYVLEKEDAISPRFVNFVTSRPLESLHQAVASSQSKLDDIETKYNLVKLLLGS